MKRFVPLFLAVALFVLPYGSLCAASSSVQESLLLHVKFTLDEPDEAPAPDGQSPQNQPAPERGTLGEVTELGSDDFRFTVEVPDGWTAENAERGGSVKKNDESSLLVFKKFSTGGMTASQFASEIGQKFGVELEKRNGTWVFQGEKDGTPLLIALSPKEEDGTAVVLVCAGSDQGGMSRIFSTVKLISAKQ